MYVRMNLTNENQINSHIHDRLNRHTLRCVFEERYTIETVKLVLVEDLHKKYIVGSKNYKWKYKLPDYLSNRINIKQIF